MPSKTTPKARAERDQREEEEEEQDGDRQESEEATPGQATYVTIHPLLRNGKLIEPDKEVIFTRDEIDHVAELVQRGIIAPRAHAAPLLDAADDARAAAFDLPSSITAPITG